MAKLRAKKETAEDALDNAGEGVEQSADRIIDDNQIEVEATKDGISDDPHYGKGGEYEIDPATGQRVPVGHTSPVVPK